MLALINSGTHRFLVQVSNDMHRLASLEEELADEREENHRLHDEVVGLRAKIDSFRNLVADD